MLLSDGDWTLRGSMLPEGLSLGVSVRGDCRLASDDDGTTLTGSLTIGDDKPRHLGARVAPDDTGLYKVQLTLDGQAVDGVGKLDSVPHLVSARNEPGDALAVTLFRTENGVGCRGFLSQDSGTLTWEVELRLERSASRPVGRSGNVVTLRRR